jgi:CPA2 family monovalent cation:H+ antiporter-2
MFGWPPLESFYAGAVVSLSSTVIIGAVFMEQGIKGKFAEIVFGILVVEDLIAIFLLTILTTVSSGATLSAREPRRDGRPPRAVPGRPAVRRDADRPRFIRAVVRMGRPETTLVASVGICFGYALLARVFGYSVALGAFIAGA